MTQRNRSILPLHSDPAVVLFDERARLGTQAARHTVEKIWLSMCLGSVVSMTFALAAKQMF